MARGRKVSLNNSALLTWAREAAGYALDEMADFLHCSPDQLRAWEVGNDAPTFAQLEKFAKKVKRSVAVLYLPAPPPEPSPPNDYRTLPDVNAGSFSPEARLAFRELRNAVADWRDLSALLGIPLTMDLPQTDLNSRSSEAAAVLRDRLGVSMETQLSWRDEYVALNAWRDMLFDRGVLAQAFSLDVDELRGFSIIDRDMGGIGVSSKDAPVARIFSVIHETAHLCLRLPGVSGDVHELQNDDTTTEGTVEHYCDRVAAHLLLPAGEPEVIVALKTLGQDLDRDIAKKLAGRFNVSKYVLALHAADLGFVSRERCWRATNIWREADRRSSSPPRDGYPPSVNTQVSRYGRRFVATVFEALDRRAVTTHEASDLLRMSIKSLEKARELVT